MSWEGGKAQHEGMLSEKCAEHPPPPGTVFLKGRGQEYLSTAATLPTTPTPLLESCLEWEPGTRGHLPCPALQKAELAPAASVGLRGREGQIWVHS